MTDIGVVRHQRVTPVTLKIFKHCQVVLSLDCVNVCAFVYVHVQILI